MREGLAEGRSLREGLFEERSNLLLIGSFFGDDIGELALLREFIDLCDVNGFIGGFSREITTGSPSPFATLNSFSLLNSVPYIL